MSGRQPALTVDTASSPWPVASTSNLVAPSPRRFRRATAQGADLPRSASLGSRSRVRSPNAVDDELLHPLRGAAQRLGIAPGASASSSSLASTTTAGSGYGTDSAYGTLDEYDDSQGEEADGTCGDEASWTARQAPGWRDRVEQSFQTRARRRVQAVLDAEGWSRRAGAVARRYSGGALPGEDDTTAPPSPDLAGDDRPFSYSYGEHSAFASSESLASSPTSPSTPSSRSSPEPSEYGGDADSGALQISLTQKRHFLLGDSPPRALLLSRRHTLPRRKTSREGLPSSESGRRSNARLECDSTFTSRGPSNAVKSKREAVRTPLARTAACLTVAVSAVSALAPFALVTPISPVHLRRAGTATEAALEITNAIFAPFLTEPTTLGVALAAGNLYLLVSLERTSSVRSPLRKALTLAFLWIAIVSLRAALSHLLGRSVGWAFPRLLSTSAIHEPAAGLAPIVLACTVDQALAQRRLPSPFDIGILAANFLVPLRSGGAGSWMPVCGAIVGLVVGAACAMWRRGTSNAPSARSGTSETKANPVWTASVVSLLFLPCLARLFVSPAPLNGNADVAFSHLHPASPTLLTVLLMTAPRPGNPDFLFRSIESWLGAFPDPVANDLYGSCPSNVSCALRTSTIDNTRPTSRIRMVVYTHFDQHEMYDLAQAHFERDPRAQHYLEWRRDPRAVRAKNRLDQRLHVARGLAYASSLDTAYVVLSEDDFPLCEDPHAGGWSRTWTRLQQALVRTNELMPDAITDDGSVTPGHCGVFFATGGSGFAIRREIAARLPALLLGAEDADGESREAAAERGEVVLKREGEDADTPDLVLQDCLRGKLAECADLCAPAVPFAPLGSARRPRGVLGDRYGKSGLAGTERLLQRHLGYNASTLPGRSYGSDEWACGWRQPFNGEPDVLTV